MAEKNGSGPRNDRKNDPDERFRYIGFEVESGKLGEHFKSDAEKNSWVKRVLAKREKGSKLREETSFDKPRVAGYERIVLTITSVILVASLFLPWFSGYKEYEVETVVAVAAPVEEILTDSAGVALTTDSAGIDFVFDSTAVTAEVVEAETGTDVLATTEGDGEEAGGTETVSVTAEIVAPPEKDEMGFASISGTIKRKEYRKEYYSASALGSFGMAGMVFSSGLILKITGALYIIYILLCLGMAGMTLYTLYGIKGDEDTLALKLKDMMKFGWIPLGIWFGCIVLAVFGANYSFDSTDMLIQLGDSYGIGTYLGLLGYGFYISLGCFIMNAVKGVEI